MNGNDGLYDKVIEPYNAPLLPLLPDPTPRNKVMSLKVVASNFPDTPSSRKNAWGKKNGPKQHVDGWETVTDGKKPRVVVVKPGRGSNTSSQLSKPYLPELGTSSSDDVESYSTSLYTSTEKLVSKASAPAVQAPAATAVSSSNAPVQLLKLLPETTESTQDHPVVSQKKLKKASREAKRKANKMLPEKPTMDTVPDLGNNTFILADRLQNIALDTATTPISDSQDAIGNQKFSTSEALVSDHEEAKQLEPVASAIVSDASTPEVLGEFASSTSPTLSLPALTKNGKHMHWTKFTRNFTVDQLAAPHLPSSWLNCSYDISCAFESGGVVDCPFHEPRKYTYVVCYTMPC